MNFLLFSLIALVLIEGGISLDAFDIIDKYCEAKNQDELRKCLAENGKSKLFSFFNTCARPLRRHVGSIKETSKFICNEANEKEDFMVRCCLAYQLRRNKDYSLPRVFETCLKRESNLSDLQQSKMTSRPAMQQQGYISQPLVQQLGFLSQSPTQQQGFIFQSPVQQRSVFQSPVKFDESADIPNIY